MHRALKRLRSSEFQDPPELVTVFESLKESQADVLTRRLETLVEFDANRLNQTMPNCYEQ
ncbi:hypothetical protein Pmar_PMAR007921 [Perkinsus marinus ATCC 50983]|uniref:Uncharacterized protein n=1 Tax=Perkinsus marinus (strain ATCC 50983 / TXsc) TaxID=423536 RepID=C5L4Q9_PERM5|nr:hypothetical protein Pmar_PMAR012153 [Perkinsus marinus ATCC 50983]XP_002776434.1 hypothetical protein Pmar_PMAR007921 [Perkinsus marinus ATCC 50983]EER01804.1 hypothetical protein Pmar_PMAR012153 [Perkinsus marinus ATCC 50983]EER08250.1 hypothetical protein Pmar_PMAR007921 [Perkinsus marinus ATCC 50983]|eukprot:XP_002769086.1 hypothetical protein Pmar_PMAR012153 [Perkinsus marinus ATCC 50983]